MRWGRLHAGVDIAAPAGTPIRAAQSGRVILMGWTGGYGNYTCIGHGNGLSTCYAHQSRYATSNGASVQQGQVIGSVGCTGHCFGDHLHFETRVGGAPREPGRVPVATPRTLVAVLPEIDILGFELQTFGLMLALALVSSGVLVAKRLKEIGLPVDWVYEMMFCAGAGGIAGAKLWYVIEKGDVGSLLSGTGLVFYGGAIGGALAVMAYAQAPRLPRLPAVRHGRPGAGDRLRGRAPRLPARRRRRLRHPVRPAVGDGLSDGTVPTTVEVHPTPIYEFLVMGAVTFWLWRRRDRAIPGEQIGWWAVLAGIERFLVEFIRRNDDILGPFSLAQFVSVVSIVLGAWWLLRVRGRAPAQRSTTAPSPRASAPRRARAAAASSSTPTPTDL